MWMLVEAPKSSNFFENDSPTGNRILLSDTSDLVIYARSLGPEGFRIIAQRGKETFLVGPAPIRGVVADVSAQLLDVAKQLGAIVMAMPPPKTA
jgi:hypothetical protein